MEIGIGGCDYMMMKILWLYSWVAVIQKKWCNARNMHCPPEALDVELGDVAVFVRIQLRPPAVAAGTPQPRDL